MIAAIYARKSTDQNIADEEKSVSRQVERARAYAERKGWAVADEHVFVDDGISGADFVNRAGLTHLLASLSPRPPYSVLIMSEQSRLGRELYETGYILKRIIDAGGRVVFYLDDREASIDDPVQKMMLQLAGFAAEMERHQARQRTRDAMQRKRAAATSPGARCTATGTSDASTTSSARSTTLRPRSCGGSSRRLRRAVALRASRRDSTARGFPRLALAGAGR
jgi:DNA invertase Pin-like site-specific DNA recombinase